MNTYLVVVWDPSQDPAKVIYFRVFPAASAAEARLEAKVYTDQRPEYTADTIKMS